MKSAQRALLPLLFALTSAPVLFGQATQDVCCAPIPLATTTWSRTLTFPQFNPSQGTLTQVAITVNTTMVGNFALENKGSAGTDTVQYWAGVRVTAGGTAPTTLNLSNSSAAPQISVSKTYSMAAYDGVTDKAGPDTITETGLTVTGTVKKILVTASSFTCPSGATCLTGQSLSGFVGAGSLSYTAVGNGSAQLTSGNANLDAQVAEQVGATITVEYTFTPPPNSVKIGDLVWNDANGNGIQDAGEAGIAGVRLNLRQNNVTLQTTFTDSNGKYSFTVAPNASYAVAVDNTTVPANYVASPSNQTTSDLDSNDQTKASPAGSNPVSVTTSNDLTIDFGYYLPRTAIGDVVWKDLNGNGKQDDGPASGIDGVVVNLYTDSACSGPVYRTTTTAPFGAQHGYYQFTNVPLGLDANGVSSTFYVAVAANQAVLTGLSATLTGQGSASTYVDDSNPSCSAVTLSPSSTQDETIDFGYVPQGDSAIGDFVWVDSNSNGVQDAGEPGVPGVTVLLSANSACTGIISQTTTDALGYYHFTGLLAGGYYVCIANSSIPAGYQLTAAGMGGDPAKDSNGAVITSYFSAFVSLPAHYTDNTIDFGFTPAGAGSIGDFVWYDVNGNGLQDAGEPGMNNVTVRLYDLTNNLLFTTVTTTFNGVSGYYQFSGLAGGTYQVVVDSATLPSGWTATTSNAGSNRAVDSNGSPAFVTLPPGGASDQTIDLGYRSSCSVKVGDFVWWDANGNGVQDSEGGIGGVAVNLRRADYSLIAFATTDANGAYSFAGLCPATYIVEAMTPAGFQATSSNTGSNRANDSNGSPAFVALSVDDSSVDFGYVLPLSIVGCAAAPANAEVGVAFSMGAPSVTGGVGPLTFSVLPHTPAGLTLNVDGSLSGTPTESGAFNIVVMDASGKTATGCPFTITPAPQLNCAAIPADLEVGVAVNIGAPTASGGVGPYTYSVAGTIVPGLTLNADGSVTGTPTAGGSFSIQVTDSNGKSATGCPISVASNPQFLTCAAIPTNAEVGVAFTMGAPTVTGGYGAFTFSVLPHTPAGLTLGANGSLTGTAQEAGTFNLVATDANGKSATGCPFSIGHAPTLTCLASTSGVAGQPYNLAGPAVNGGAMPYTFSIGSGALPAGLLLNTGNGAITGTPLVAGAWTLQVRDAQHVLAAGSCPYSVTAPPVSPVIHGDAATIGFWNNKNGQALILSMNGSSTSTQLANWLAAVFPSLYSASSAHDLTGKTNVDVAALFQAFFAVNGQNTDAQVMAGALAAYVSTPALAGSTVAASYGFNVSPGGTAVKYYNTGSNGTAIGLANNTSYTVFQLLQAANAVSPYSSAAFDALNTIFNGINTTGDIK
jgi:hypothetical protein